MGRKSNKPQQVSAIANLLDNPIVDGYEIKEWSIKQFSSLYPVLKSVVISLQEQGLTFDNAENFLEKNYMVIVDSCVPVLPELLTVSLNLTEKQIEEMPATKGSMLGLAVLQKNTEHLVSFLAQIQRSLGDQDQIQPTT